MPQSAADLFVEGHHPFAGVDDKQNDVGRIDGDLNLLFDVLR